MGSYKISKQLVLGCAKPPCNYTVAGTDVQFTYESVDEQQLSTGSPPPAKRTAENAAVLVCATDGFALTLRGLHASGGTINLMVTRDAPECRARGFYHDRQPHGHVHSALSAGFQLTVDTVTVSQNWQQQDGLHLLKLTSADTVHLLRLCGVLNITDSEDATILATFHQGKTDINQAPGGKVLWAQTHRSVATTSRTQSCVEEVTG